MSNHNKQPSGSEQDKSGGKISRRALLKKAGAAAVVAGLGVGAYGNREAIQDWSERAEQEYAKNQAAKAEQRANDEATAVAEHNSAIAEIKKSIEAAGLTGELDLMGIDAVKIVDAFFPANDEMGAAVSFAKANSDEIVTWLVSLDTLKPIHEEGEETVVLDFDTEELLKRRTHLNQDLDDAGPLALKEVTVHINSDTYNTFYDSLEKE